MPILLHDRHSNRLKITRATISHRVDAVAKCPLASGGTGVPPGPSSSPQSTPTTSPPSSPTLPPSMQQCNSSFTRFNLYLNMVLNAIYYFPMMYGYPMMFE